MQGLAQQVTALRPELVNSDATVGEMAWVWGKDHADQGSTWRRRLWFEGDRLAGWGWIFLPYQVMRSDGQLLDITRATLTWQVHPDAAALSTSRSVRMPARKGPCMTRAEPTFSRTIAAAASATGLSGLVDTIRE